MPNKEMSKLKIKKSEVEWIGDIPETWNVAKISTSCMTGSGTTPPSHEQRWYTNEDEDEGVFWVNTSELRERVIQKPRKKVTVEATKAFPTLKKYNEGTILVAMYGATIGRVGVLGVKAVTNQACCAVKSKQKTLLNPYLFYWFCSMRGVLEEMGNGGGQPNISQNVISNLRFPLPPVDEQKAIAEFLDRETAILDKRLALIEKKCVLLSELKKSVIHEAVTKGLDKSVAMKGSGVEWIGDVPQSWTIGRLKDVARIGAGNPAPKPEELCEDVEACSFLRVSDLGQGTDGNCTTTKSHVFDPRKHGLKIWKAGTIVLPKSGESIRSNARAYLGKDMAVVSHLACIVAQKKVCRSFLFWTLKVVDFESKINQTALPALGLDVIAEYEIAIPSYAEQEGIAEFLDQRVGQLDKLLLMLSRQEKLIKEQRKALIHEVVTGKRRVI